MGDVYDNMTEDLLQRQILMIQGILGAKVNYSLEKSKRLQIQNLDGVAG